MTSATYPAIRIQQTDEGAPIVLFAAPAVDIEAWAGVVQRQQMGDGNETIGFQRAENAARVHELEDFYSNRQNVMQNPLLCAVRDEVNCVFTATGKEASGMTRGNLKVTWRELESLSIHELLRELEEELRKRLKSAPKPPDEIVARVKEQTVVEDDIDDEEEASDERDTDADGTADDAPPIDVFFTEETHLLDFLNEVAARVQVLEEMEDPPEDEFAGFTKEAVASYLRPVLLVDGQHRLRGAVEAARARLDKEKKVRREVTKHIRAGDDPDSVRAQLTKEYGRTLPVSLLLEPKAEDHVFQFVIVNQKATPIGRALLGTIVSTSLTKEELDRVSSRLTNAGIALEAARAITYLSRSLESPFQGLVQRGLPGERGNLLPWTVLVTLAGMFRELKGGRFFGEQLDYAEAWARNHLAAAAIVSATTLEDARKEWGADEGPWREVFIRVFRAIRDRFGDNDDADARNYWGGTGSNLFNKVSLTILAADFFAFMRESRRTLAQTSDVDDIAEDWLSGVDPTYFKRDWKLEGVKKDSTGIRNQWADVWFRYRRDRGCPVRRGTSAAVS